MFANSLQMLICTLLRNIILTPCTNKLHHNDVSKLLFIRSQTTSWISSIVCSVYYYCNNVYIYKQFVNLHEVLMKLHELGGNFSLHSTVCTYVRTYVRLYDKYQPWEIVLADHIIWQTNSNLMIIQSFCTLSIEELMISILNILSCVINFIPCHT